MQSDPGPPRPSSVWVFLTYRVESSVTWDPRLLLCLGGSKEDGIPGSILALGKLNPDIQLQKTQSLNPQTSNSGRKKKRLNFSRRETLCWDCCRRWTNQAVQSKVD